MAEYDNGRAEPSSATPAAPPLQRGKLTGFDAAELSGWITSDDGRLYRFSAANVIGDEQIAAGQSVTFMDIGENAYQVRRDNAIADLAAPVSTPVAASASSAPLSARPAPPFVPAPETASMTLPQRKPVEGLHASRPTAAAWTAPTRKARAGGRGNTLFLKVLMAMALIGALAVFFIQREVPPVTPPMRPPAATTAEPPVPELPSVDPSAQPAAKPASESDSRPKARPAQAAAQARPELQLTEQISRTEEVVRSSKPPAATIEAPALSAWWPEPRRGSLNLEYAGHLAGAHAIALMFDSPFADTGDWGNHIQVTGSTGAPVVGRWRVGSNPTMLLMATPPGLYKLVISPTLANAAGLSLGLRLSGSVLVR